MHLALSTSKVGTLGWVGPLHQVMGTNSRSIRVITCELGVVRSGEKDFEQILAALQDIRFKLEWSMYETLSEGKINKNTYFVRTCTYITFPTTISLAGACGGEGGVLTSRMVVVITNVDCTGL